MKSFDNASGNRNYKFKIQGDNTPYVEFTLQPGARILAESGTFMAKQPAVTMAMAVGDGTSANPLTKLFNAAKRKMSGDNVLLANFENKANHESVLLLASPYPGEVIGIDLEKAGGSIICQRGAFMAAPAGTQVDIHLRKKLATSLFGGEGFVMQKITGKDHVLLNAGGNFTSYKLAAGQSLQVDTGCLLAVSESVEMGVEMIPSVGTMMFGQEGLFQATLKGPGTVWLQSMPFNRQIGTIAQQLDQRYKKGLLSNLGLKK